MSIELQVSELLRQAEDRLNEAEVLANKHGIMFTFKPKYAPTVTYDGLADRWDIHELPEWADHQGFWLASH